MDASLHDFLATLCVHRITITSDVSPFSCNVGNSLGDGQLAPSFSAFHFCFLESQLLLISWSVVSFSLSSRNL